MSETFSKGFYSFMEFLIFLVGAGVAIAVIMASIGAVLIATGLVLDKIIRRMEND